LKDPLGDIHQRLDLQDALYPDLIADPVTTAVHVILDAERSRQTLIVSGPRLSRGDGAAAGG
jgi:hypothetical protein